MDLNEKTSIQSIHMAETGYDSAMATTEDSDVLSPKALAVAIGVSESSLKRWTDEGLIRAYRTAGGHRRIPRSEAIRFIRTSQATLVQPATLGLPELDVFTGDLPTLEEAGRRLGESLSCGDARESRGMLLALYMAGHSLAEIVDGPLSTAMATIGDLWRHSEAGVFIEHRATDIAMAALSQLRLMIEVEPGAPTALGAALSRDPYILPSLAVATALASEGFHAVNLGPNTPAATIQRAINELNPLLVWISINHVPDTRRAGSDLKQIAFTAHERDAITIIGGREAQRLTIPAGPAIHFLRTLAEITAFARGLRDHRFPNG